MKETEHVVDESILSSDTSSNSGYIEDESSDSVNHEDGIRYTH